MPIWQAVLIVIALVAFAILMAYFRRRSIVPLPATPITPPPDDSLARHARQKAAEIQGTELLERRVTLDSKRGTLGGDDAIFDALVAAEDRFTRGEITQAEFEAEKVRLLSG